MNLALSEQTFTQTSQRQADDLKKAFQAGLRAVDGRKLVAKRLKDAFPDRRPIHLAAVGKAASAMVQGAFDALDGRIKKGLVVSTPGLKEETALEGLPLRLLEAGYPSADRHSLMAGVAWVEFLRKIPPNAYALILVSGGAGSLLENLPWGMNLKDLERAEKWLAGCGWSQEKIHAVRRSFSNLKGGRLAVCIEGRETLGLVLSEAHGEASPSLEVDLLSPAPEGPGFRRSDLPPWLERLTNMAPPPPAKGDPAFDAIYLEVLGNNRTACWAAAQEARKQGYRVHLHPGSVQGDAEEAGRALAAFLKTAPLGMHIWGSGAELRWSEEGGGDDGPNRRMALAAAAALEGERRTWIMAASTSGEDGSGDAAGALVDGGTAIRGRLAGFDPDEALAQAASGRFLAESGDLFVTGRTGTHVMDVVLGLKE